MTTVWIILVVAAFILGISLGANIERWVGPPE